MPPSLTLTFRNEPVKIKTPLTLKEWDVAKRERASDAGPAVYKVAADTKNIYKGMNILGAAPLRSSDIANSFARTMIWLGDDETADKYFCRAHKREADSDGAAGKAVLVQYTACREIVLFDLLDHKNIENLRLKITARVDALTLLKEMPRESRPDMKAFIKAIKREGLFSPLQSGLRVDMEILKYGYWKLCIGLATGFMPWEDQRKQIKRYAAKGQFEIRKARTLTDFSPINFADDKTFGTAADQSNRASFMQVDRQVVQAIQEFYPALDGYFAPATPSTWHLDNVFHAEMALFHPKYCIDAESFTVFSPGEVTDGPRPVDPGVTQGGRGRKTKAVRSSPKRGGMGEIIQSLGDRKCPLMPCTEKKKPDEDGDGVCWDDEEAGGARAPPVPQGTPALDNFLEAIFNDKEAGLKLLSTLTTELEAAKAAEAAEKAKEAAEEAKDGGGGSAKGQRTTSATGRRAKSVVPKPSKATSRRKPPAAKPKVKGTKPRTPSKKTNVRGVS